MLKLRYSLQIGILAPNWPNCVNPSIGIDAHIQSSSSLTVLDRPGPGARVDKAGIARWLELEVKNKWQIKKHRQTQPVTWLVLHPFSKLSSSQVSFPLRLLLDWLYFLIGLPFAGLPLFFLCGQVGTGLALVWVNWEHISLSLGW